jgi:thioredoxin 1
MLSVSYFTASWCGPCKVFGPALLEFAAQNNLVVEKIDVDSHGDVAMSHDIMSIPTTIWFKDGKPVKTIVGAKSTPDLAKILREVESA